MACGLSKFLKEVVVINTVRCVDLYIFTCSSTSGPLSECYGRRCSYLFSKCSFSNGDDRALPIGSRHGRHISNFLALFFFFLHLGSSVIFRRHESYIHRCDNHIFYMGNCCLRFGAEYCPNLQYLEVEEECQSIRRFFLWKSEMLNSIMCRSLLQSSQPYRTSVESMGRNSFTPRSKVWCSLPPSSWNSYAVNFF
jgi:hypothetical protein